MTRSRSTVRLSLCSAAIASLAVAGFMTAHSADASELATSHAGPAGGIIPATANVHAQNNARPGGSTSSNLIYHGGPVMKSAVAQAIFWGSSWSNSSFVGDKMSGLDSFYNGISGTKYAGTNTEYTDSSGSHVGSSVSYAGHIVDTTAAPSRAPKTSDILAEVQLRITNPVANGYYPVYVDTKRGHTGYCAWHSNGTVTNSTGQSVSVQFAFFFNLDGDSGCDPKDTATTHSQGLAALANVSGHELSEAVTDPALNAWYDSSGAENSDKCAWTFGTKLVTFANGSSWKIQGNYSNAAAAAKTGYDGKGCIDGN